MKARGRGFLLVTFALLAGAAAQAAPPLALEQAIEQAMASSRLLAAAESDLGAARATERQAGSARLPSVIFSEEALRTDNPTLVFSNKLGQERFTAADFDLASLNQPDALTNFRSRLSFEVPVWTGGRTQNTTRAAREGSVAAAEDRERTRQRVVHQVVDAYLGAVVAERQLAVAHGARKTVAAHLELVRNLFEAGQVVESDLLQVRVRESEVEEQVIRAGAAVAVAHAALNLAMGAPQESEWSLDPEIATRGAGPEESLDELLQTALDRRPDLAAVQARLEAASAGRAATRAGARPGLFAGAFAEANGEDPASFDGDNWGAQVSLRWKLFDGFATRRAVERADHEVEAATHRAALFEQGIALEVRRAFHEARAAAQGLEQAERAVAWAERSLAIVEDRYREGLATLVELLQAETSLAETRARRVAAAGERARAASALDLAVGRL